MDLGKVEERMRGGGGGSSTFIGLPTTSEDADVDGILALGETGRPKWKRQGGDDFGAKEKGRTGLNRVPCASG